jgi:Ca2+-binding EF-hand superfamily protein
LRNFGIVLSNEELSIVFNAFDRNRNGVVDFQEFIGVLKGEINNKRIELIQKAFTVLSDRFRGEVTFENLIKAFEAKHHPDVKPIHLSLKP